MQSVALPKSFAVAAAVASLMATTVFLGVQEASASSGAPAMAASPCRVPEPELPLEPTYAVSMFKPWGWGRFRYVGTPVFVCLGSCATPRNSYCCARRQFVRYEIWEDLEGRWIQTSPVPDGYRVWYQKFNETWLGITYQFRTADDHQAGRPTGCADLRRYRGISFDVLGSSALRVQIDEGLGGKDQGEGYHVLVSADPSVPRSVEIPFGRFTRRLDHQYAYRLPAYEDHRLDVSRIRGF
ncbi:hypothetical protein L0Y59_01185, partial [Candidatus Uhrbacteria bacterium]|nr:hypothetical protein [Candidatus Uhrbacteria bacterium]